jgi:putative nucleotidyltransferase with HDIG domain
MYVDAELIGILAKDNLSLQDLKQIDDLSNPAVSSACHARAGDHAEAIRYAYLGLAEPQDPLDIDHFVRTSYFYSMQLHGTSESGHKDLSHFFEALLESKPRGPVLEVVAASSIPEMDLVRSTIGYEQEHPSHYKFLFDHLAKTAEHLPRDLDLRLAGFFHDIGKMATKKYHRGRVIFPKHAKVGAVMASVVLYGVTGLDNEKIHTMIRRHMPNYASTWSNKAVDRYKRKCGKYLDEVFTLIKADTLARPNPGSLKWYYDLRETMGLERNSTTQ